MTSTLAITTGRQIAADLAVQAWHQTLRVIRTAKAVINACRKHLPRWLGAVLAVALAIPGPQDELLVLLVIAGFVAFKPVMRADVLAAMRTTWNASRTNALPNH